MRVLNCFTDPRLGGPGQRSLDVGTELVKRGVDVHFLVPDGDDSLANAATKAGFEVHRLRIPRIRSPRDIKSNLQFLGTFRRTTRRIRQLLDSLSPDIVHINTPYNFQTARAAYLSDGALVWHFNDTLTPWPVNRIAGRLATHWADEIVVSANAVHDNFFISDVETTTLYPPVDLEEFDPDKYQNAPAELRDEFGLEDAGPIVGAVGNVNPAKGHRYLLEAVPDVLEQFPDAKLFIVGSQLNSQQRYFDELHETISRLGIEDAVQFIGWRSDVPELLSLFDLFILPSVTEACPIVVLEAMAMRCPVVATNVGGVSEQLPSSEYGWVIQPEDSSEIAHSIKSVLTSPSHRRMCVQKSRERVRDLFSLTACADSHMCIYKHFI